MLKYTRAVVNDAIKDLKFFLYIFSIITQFFYLAYITYVLIKGSGIFYLNIALGIISLAYLIFFLTVNEKNKKTKHVAYVFRHTKTILKLCINAITLVVAVYGIYISASNVDAISLMLVILMIVFWCVQVVLEVIVFFFEHKKNMFLAGLQKDIEPLTNAVNVVGNVVRKVAGKEPVKKEPLPSRVEAYLDKVLAWDKQRKEEDDKK